MAPGKKIIFWTRHIAKKGLRYCMDKENLRIIASDRSKEIDINMGVFRTRIFTVSELSDMLESKKLHFIGGAPFKTWSKSHKSLVIESLLLGLPPDPIIIDGYDTPWFVADGAELLSNIHEYLCDGFKLDSVNFNLQEYYGEPFSKLPLMLRSRLLNLKINATIITSEATTIYRLSVYSSALLKIGKEKGLWNCAQEIYKSTFNKLNELAHKLNADNPQTLLQIILAIVYADSFKKGSFKSELDISEIRFDMFECLALKDFDSIYEYVKKILKKNQAEVRIVLELSKKHGKELATKTGKKSRIFIITTTLLALESKGIDSSKIIHQFKAAWKESKGFGKGYLNEDYATKSNIIYNILR